MTGWELFTSAWDWEPSVLAGTGLLLVGYLVAARFRFDRPALLFISGVLVMFLALVSPLDALGDDYLFSAHMLQHILLDLVAPPLFVLGLSERLVAPLLRWRFAARFERILRRPPLAWALGTGTLWLWHLPALYNATLENEAVHVFEHLSFLVTGTIFWWPIFSPIEARRIGCGGSLIYLLLAALANGLLGAIFTIASTPFYSPYFSPKDELHALSLLRNTWGLTPLVDQQLGGAFMWVIGSLIFLWAILAVVTRWYKSESTTRTGPDATGGIPPAVSEGPKQERNSGCARPPRERTAI